MEIYKGILLYFSKCKFQFINEYINNHKCSYQLFQFCTNCANVVKILLLLYYYYYSNCNEI